MTNVQAPMTNEDPNGPWSLGFGHWSFAKIILRRLSAATMALDRLRHRLAITKTITHAPHRLDHIGPLAQLAPQRPNMHVDRPLHHHRVLAQRRIDQLRALEDSPRLPNESVEQPEFAARQRQRRSFDRGLMPSAID